MTPTVPWQLVGEKFIVLSEKGKNPVQRWSLPEHQYTADKIQRWLDEGWNYAVLYQTDICVFDADNAERLMELGVIDALPRTFTVMSGRDGMGLHLYFRMPNPPEGTKIYLYDNNGDELGDIRLPKSRFYNVGPGSIHPSGRPYQVINDVPLAILDWEILKQALSRLTVKVAGVQRDLSFDTDKQQPSTMDEYGFTVLDFLSPLAPRVRGDEIEGTHPIHGSSTGNNLTVKTDGSVWWCRRCGSGGGWIDALAVSEGIIDCSEAHPDRTYSKEEWKKINEVLRRLKPDVHEKILKKWMAERNASSLDKLRMALSSHYNQVKT